MNPDTKDDMEVPVEQLREGMYVKTYKHGYIRMKQLASKIIENPETDERSQNRLYICEPGDSFPELTEPYLSIIYILSVLIAVGKILVDSSGRNKNFTLSYF